MNIFKRVKELEKELRNCKETNDMLCDKIYQLQFDLKYPNGKLVYHYYGNTDCRIYYIDDVSKDDIIDGYKKIGRFNYLDVNISESECKKEGDIIKIKLKVRDSYKYYILSNNKSIETDSEWTVRY